MNVEEGSKKKDFESVSTLLLVLVLVRCWWLSICGLLNEVSGLTVVVHFMFLFFFHFQTLKQN
jgi:hypothetical protein